MTDPANKRPLKLAGNQALLSVGAVAALAACHGLDEYTRTGRPVHVDVSAQEAIIATGPVLQVSLRMLNCPGVAGARRYGAPAGYYRCRDGLVRISVMEDHQWQALLRALDHPDWARGLVTSEDRKAHDELIDEHVTAALATWTKADCEQRLQAEGVPVAAMYTASDLAQAPHLGDRGAYREQTVGTTTIRTVGLPFRYRPSAKPRSVRAGLTGLRVTEVGHVLAAPLASALLGAMGADVTKLEDPERLDMYRRRGPYVDGIESPDHSAYFAIVNHSKSSIVMAMTREPDRLADHLSKVDVLIENLGQSRARRLNIDSATLAQSHPDVLAVSSSGFGYTGRWSAFRAYAYNLHTAGGLAYLTRGSNGEPAELDLAWADLISGYALATIIAAWAVGKDTQYGAAIDFSMFDLVVQRFNEFIAAAFGGVADGEDLDASNHLRPFAPHAVYPAAGDRWLAIAVDGDPQWLALRAALGRPPELFRDEFSTAAHRDVHQDELDLILKSLISTRNAFDLERKLQSAGVAANVVLDADDLLTDTHLAARAFYPSVTHPVWGQRNLVGLPWRFVGGMPVILGPPPQLRLTPSKQPAPT